MARGSWLLVSVGIFRLTDPPGLQTIQNCNAEQAFHPHPDGPIYTVCPYRSFDLLQRLRKFPLQDADKGHVQLCEATLEIVDLR
jgi:STAM-binding protein